MDVFFQLEKRNKILGMIKKNIEERERTKERGKEEKMAMRLNENSSRKLCKN